MLVRYRWYSIRLPKSVESLADILLERPFTQNDSYGFARLNGDIEGSQLRFYWKTKVIVTNFDELGNSSYSDIVNINYNDFSLVNIGSQLFMRVDNPGRNIRDLLNAIESIVGLGFTSESITFGKFDPLKVFFDADSIKLIGLKVTDVVLSDDLVSRIEFASKQGINLSELKILDGLKYKVDTGVYELTYESARGQISVSSGGLVKISGQLAPKLLHQLEGDLQNCK